MLYKLSFISKELSIHVICSIFLLWMVFKHKLYYINDFETYTGDSFNVTYVNNNVNIDYKNYDVFMSNGYIDIYMFEVFQYMYQIYIYYYKPFDLRDKQHSLMFVHHFFTIFLIVLSWYCHLIKYGVFILFIHDISDIMLDLCKITSVIQTTNFLGKLIIIMLNFCWIFFRLILFPCIIYNIYLGPPIVSFYIFFYSLS